MASFRAMLISSKTPKPPHWAHWYTGPGRNTTSPFRKVSVPSMEVASTLMWKEIFHIGRWKAAARFSANTFLPVALGPASSRFWPHSRAAMASSQTFLP